MEQDKLFHQVIILNDEIPPPFSVGMFLNLDLLLKQTEHFRFRVRLVGWIKSNFLITSIFDYKTPIMATPVGTEVIARSVLEGRIFGFNTRLSHKQTDPFPLLYFEYPKQIEVKNMRSSPRISLTLEVKTNGGKIYYTKDISKKGASLFINSKSEIDNIRLRENLVISFKFPDTTKIENLKAEIVRKYQENNNQFIGLRFDENNRDELRKISRYIENIEEFYQQKPNM